MPRALHRLIVPCILLMVLAVPALSHARQDGAGPARTTTLAAAARASTTEPSDARAAAPAAGKDDDAAAEPREWIGYGVPWAKWSTMTGDWASVRRDLKRIGVELQVGVTADLSDVASGSLSNPVVGRALAKTGLALDFEKLAGLRGTRALLQYQRKRGGFGPASTGDAQGFSNIDADDFGSLYEVWVEQTLLPGLRVKVGQIDANTEFAFVENGGAFINPSMGFSPTIFVLPTYPSPHLGVIAQAQPSKRFWAGIGIFRDEMDQGGTAGPRHEAFAIGEVGVRWALGGGGRLGVGYWHHTGSFPLVRDEGASVKASGQYMVFDQVLWSGGTDDSPKSVAAFAQVGLSNRHISPIARHLGGGVLATGLVPGRPSDSVGVGVTTVSFGDQPVADANLQGEVNLGAFYRLALTAWMAIKPDLQVILRPSGEAGRKVVTATARFEVTF
jgi:porin